MDGREGLDESGDVDESEDRDALVFIVMEFEVAQDCSSTCEKTSKNDKIKVIEYILSGRFLRFGRGSSLGIRVKQRKRNKLGRKRWIL